jgi:hypothetical protein
MTLTTKLSLISALAEVFKRRPLVNVQTAAYLSDASQDTIRKRIETGDLCAWDLRQKNARKRGCVRILAISLNGPVNEAGVYSWVPTWNPTATQLTRLFGVSQTLVATLLLDGSLKQIGKPTRQKESPKIDRASLVAFLKSRHIGAQNGEKGAR